MTNLPPRRLWAVLFVLSIIGAAFVVICTPAGMATTSDSVNYISAARSLLAGEGLRDCPGNVYV
ncbi:MAG: hypothetical protein K8I30_10690, partial [Anaerolineae bacterium]|nr:hypothetical protein [Anaerolineae bacterium]